MDNTFLQCSNFALAKASEPKGCFLRPIKIIRTTHSDNPYGGKGMVGTTQRDDPDTSKRLSERPKGYPLFRAAETSNFQFFNFLILTMSQKFIKSQNKNSHSPAHGKYFTKAVYDNSFIETEQLAEFIQTQASVKKSDIKAVLDELGGAMKHFFEMGQKIRLDGIGIFKVGFSSIGVIKLEDCGAANITTRRVLFQPETTRVVVGQEKKANGSVKQKYVNAITLLKDVVFEETHENAMKATASSGSNSGSSTGGNNSGSGSNTGGGGDDPDNGENPDQ